MNISSLFHGLLGTLTLTWVGVILLVFLCALIMFIKKSREIIKDCDSLKFPASEDELSKTKVGRLLLNYHGETSDYSEDSISIFSVAEPYRLNLRLTQSVPSILTSLGILGTFVGLALSVFSFDSSSSEGIRKSIETLLGGMSTAFFTSVAGMLFSVLFLWIERIIYNTLSNSVDALCSKINKQYHRPTGVLLDEGLEKISSKLDCLEIHFGDNLDKVFDSKVTPFMAEITEKLSNPAQAVVDGLINEFRNISEGFASHLTQQVNDKMDELLGQFILATDSIKELPGTIDSARVNLEKSGEKAIEAQKDFTKQSQERLEKYTTDLTSAVKGQLKEIQYQYAAVNNALKSIPEEINKSVDAQKNVANEVSKQIENIGDFEKIYADAIEKISAANNDLADAKSNMVILTTKISDAAKAIEASSSGMIDSNKKMLSDFEAIYELNQGITKQVKDYSERISGIEKGLKGIFAEIENGLTSYSNTTKNNMQGLLDGFSTAVTNAMRDISNATTPLHEITSEIFKALDKTEKSTRALLEHIESVSSNKTNR